MEDNNSRFSVVQICRAEGYNEMFIYKVCIRLQSNDEQEAITALRLFRKNYPKNEFRLLVNL